MNTYTIIPHQVKKLNLNQNQKIEPDCSMNTKMIQSNKPVLVFDGTCVLCNHFFQWFVQKDAKQNLIFHFFYNPMDFERPGFGDPSTGQYRFGLAV